MLAPSTVWSLLSSTGVDKSGLTTSLRWAARLEIHARAIAAKPCECRWTPGTCDPCEGRIVVAAHYTGKKSK